MPEEVLTMSNKELDRLAVIQHVTEKRLTREAAAKQLRLTPRQVGRLLCRYRQEGPSGLVSRRRGKPSNRQHGAELKHTAIKHVTERYRDFGPTLAAEKLQAHHQLTVNKETLRQWMIEAGLWHGKIRHSSPTHQSRTRRPCLGELVQIDGSPHDWYEGRAPACCLS